VPIVESFAGEGGRQDYAESLPAPMRYAFADMSGVVFGVWIPVLLAFFLPWEEWGSYPKLFAGMDAGHVVVALIIAIPPWFALTKHLARGRLWDGILDMLLWAIWESLTMIALCYLYPDRAQHVIWNASNYWNDMRGWIASGSGTEADPARWLPLQGVHLIALVVAAFIFGLPALVMGTFLLNYMNFYVAQCMMASREPLLTMAVAWHFWSVIRVVGYIMIASAIYQLELLSLQAKRARIILTAVVGALSVGFLLVILDALLKWQYTGVVRQALMRLTGLGG
jgi:hypothetical protein